MLPEYFRPILWSVEFDQVDPVRHRQSIITAAINYGDLRHWRWLIGQYGRDGVRETLETLPETALRPQAARLAAVVFDIQHFAHAPRRALA